MVGKFCAALRAWPGLPDDTNIEAWLVTVSRRRSIDVIRARAHRPAPGGDLPERPSSLSPGFQLTVQEYLPRIECGQTRPYKEVAELVGNPQAMRAVGTACATNPLPVVAPCHRVLRTGGALGGHIGGLDAKTALLALERAAD